jgi:hypothetical protein
MGINALDDRELRYRMTVANLEVLTSSFLGQGDQEAKLHAAWT